MDRIQEIDNLIAETYSKIHQLIQDHKEEVDTWDSRMIVKNIDAEIERIAALKVERAYWVSKK